MFQLLVTVVPASEEEVRASIKKSADKSRELDPIQTWLVVQCLDQPRPLVDEIINTSMNIGYFTKEFKCEASPNKP